MFPWKSMKVYKSVSFWSPICVRISEWQLTCKLIDLIDMEFTTEIKKATEPIYQKISKVLPEIEWPVHDPYIHKINKLKKEKNAVILAHNYQTPEIYHGVADFAADSLALAIEASKTSANIILMAGVHFMAETAKLMSPNKKVILPDMDAGCSLSSSITGKDVRLLKEK